VAPFLIVAAFAVRAAHFSTSSKLRQGLIEIATPRYVTPPADAKISALVALPRFVPLFESNPAIRSARFAIRRHLHGSHDFAAHFAVICAPHRQARRTDFTARL
jgi:hypothetical protein